MAQVLIRNLDEKVIKKLKARAAKNERSLQAELQLILERAAEVDPIDPLAAATKIRQMLSGRKFSDTTELLAEDRRR